MLSKATVSYLETVEYYNLGRFSNKCLYGDTLQALIQGC